MKKFISMTSFCLALIIAIVPVFGTQIVDAASKPGKAVISSVKANSKTAVTVKWKKVSGAKGYQIRYSKKSSMSNAKKISLIAKTKKITKLNAGTKYYVQVRAYKKRGSKKRYGKWSAKKSVITHYSIKYVLNGGVQASGQKTSYSKTTATFTLKSPTRQGFVFDGWFTSNAFKTKVTSVKKGTMGNKVFYAKWSVKQGTKDNPLDPTKPFSLSDYNGTINARLIDTYVGEAALSKLESMGEDRSNFTFNGNPDYKTVVLEYSVKVIKGKFFGDLLGGEMYEPNKTSKMDFLCYELRKNADRDLFGGDVSMNAGYSDTLYAVYGIPTEFQDFYEKIDSTDDYAWFHYSLK